MEDLQKVIADACIEATFAAWRQFEEWLGIASDLAALERDDMQSMPENMMQVAIASRLYAVVREVAYVTLEEQAGKKLTSGESRYEGRKIDVVAWNREGHPLCLVEAKRGSAWTSLAKQLDEVAMLSVEQTKPHPFAMGVVCRRSKKEDGGKLWFEKQSQLGDHRHSLIASKTIAVEHKDLRHRGPSLGVGVYAARLPPK